MTPLSVNVMCKIKEEATGGSWQRLLQYNSDNLNYGLLGQWFSFTVSFADTCTDCEITSLSCYYSEYGNKVGKIQANKNIYETLACKHNSEYVKCYRD